MIRIALAALAASALLTGTASAQQQIDWDKIQIKTTDLGNNTYMLEGQGGNITVAVGTDGIIMVDGQFAPMHDKLKAAINDGAQIIIQGASSAIGGQITADVQKHNARNPGKELMWINVGAEAMEFTGPKCHFYHFRWNGNAERR